MVYMVKLTHLRIGSMVYTYERQYGSIQSFGNKVLVKTFNGTRGYTLEQLSPIPLNLDILSICGFSLSGAVYMHKDTYVSLRHHEEGDVELVYNDEILEELAFVHQFQSIYFDVTGEQLQPNLIGI